MKRIFASIGLLLLLVLAATCSSPTEPGNNNGNLPDTTSHNFVWQKYTFGGGGGSSVLHDVAVINDTLAYAVGEIYVNDATGQPDPNLYNLAKWNGKEWDLERVTVNFRGSSIIPPLEGIFCFSSSQIWLVGSLPIYGDGSNWTMYDLRTTLDPNVSLSKAWGSDPQNMYFVGRNGSMVHYANGSWQKIESGTNIDIQDIWGEIDQKTNQATVLAVASLLNYGRALNLLQIKNNSATMLDTTGLHVNQHSIWFQTDKVFYVVGNGVYKKNSLSDIKWVQENGHPFLYKEAIRGNNWNDLFIVGDFGLVSHYNGSSWKHYNMSLPTANFYSVSVKGNIVAAVGQDGDNAVITIGRRN